MRVFNYELKINLTKEEFEEADGLHFLLAICISVIIAFPISFFCKDGYMAREWCFWGALMGFPLLIGNMIIYNEITLKKIK